MEVRFVEAYSKYASNNDRSVATQLNHHMVHVAVECMQGNQFQFHLVQNVTAPLIRSVHEHLSHTFTPI